MALVDTWRWDEEAYVLAWEAGVFRDQRVELVEGEVWPVRIGLWHGAVAGNVTRLLPDGERRVTSASLPASGSLTDPDVWAHRRGARPVAAWGRPDGSPAGAPVTSRSSSRLPTRRSRPTSR